MCREMVRRGDSRVAARAQEEKDPFGIGRARIFKKLVLPPKA